MINQTIENKRINHIHPLISPAVLSERFPVSKENAEFIFNSRKTIEDILSGKDKRLIVIVGPCSVHDAKASLQYANRLLPIIQACKKNLYIVMRVYFEKPRTIIGWKGLINDPDLNGTYQINKGLRIARKLLLEITTMSIACGTEFLDTALGQFYADLISWGAIGARTAESQVHRQLASGLSMPVGIKNRTDGNIQVALDAIQAAKHRHLFPSLTKEGMPAIFETTGNQYCHLVLRGGSKCGPNYSTPYISEATEQLKQANLHPAIMVDCSHANSDKNHDKQKLVVSDLIQQKKAGNQSIKGIMLESHLIAGRQNYNRQEPLTFGQSITDACISIEETESLLLELNHSWES